MKYEMGLVVADGDFVMVHARITGFGPKPLIGVDIFRAAILHFAFVSPSEKLQKATSSKL
jgi:hypothetical protein